jgi:tetratricopeptide (TPR) repeat protein
MNKSQLTMLSLKAEASKASRANDPEEAIRLYLLYLEQESNKQDDDAWAGLGGAYRRKGDVNSAINSYETALNIKSQSTYALVNIISLLAARDLPGDQEKLQKYLPDAIRLTSSNATTESDHWSWYDLATTQLVEGLFDESMSEKAVKNFDYAIEKTPQGNSKDFESVLSNLTFMAERNPNISQITQIIQKIKDRIEEIKRMTAEKDK